MAKTSAETKDLYLQLKISSNNKKQFEEICDKIGITVSAALSVCVNAIIRENGFPFPVIADKISKNEIVSNMKDSTRFATTAEISTAYNNIISKHSKVYEELAK